jgi:ABC-type nitrate/sulfonate/bicarbonate transport system ATPase subunit
MASKIAVKGLRKAYSTRKGPLPVLDGVEFTVADGEFVAIVGPSGCGKTTLLHILAGFDRGDSGEVTVDDKPVSGPSRKSIVVFQRGSVFPWLTVRQNLTLALDGLPQSEGRRLVDHYVALAGLQGFERAFPYQLSGGMLQRVELARALVTRPEILYLDEPLGSLDALTRLRMRGELLRLLSRERCTTVMVTHDVEEALHLSHRILIFSPRPARILSTVEVSFPHPRALSNPGMIALKARILRELGVEDAV